MQKSLSLANSQISVSVFYSSCSMFRLASLQARVLLRLMGIAKGRILHKRFIRQGIQERQQILSLLLR